MLATHSLLAGQLVVQKNRGELDVRQNSLAAAAVAVCSSPGIDYFLSVMGSPGKTCVGKLVKRDRSLYNFVFDSELHLYTES